MMKNGLPEERFADLGKSLTLFCNITGEPKPYISWFKNAVPLNPIPDTRYVFTIIQIYFVMLYYMGLDIQLFCVFVYFQILKEI